MGQPHPFEILSADVAAAVRSGDARAAADLIEAGWRETAAEHGQGVRDLIHSLPPEAWGDRPAFAAALGATARSADRSDPASALAYFEAASALLPHGDAMTPDAARIVLAHAAALRAVGRSDEVATMLHEVRLVLVRNLAAHLSWRIGLQAGLSLQLGLLALHRGEFDSAVEHLQIAEGLAEPHLTRAERVECYGAMAMLANTRGDTDDALALVARSRAAAEGTTLLHSAHGAAAVTTERLVAIERGQMERARALDEVGGRASRGTEWEPFHLVVSAHLEGREGQHSEALESLRRARRQYRAWPTTGVGYVLAECLRAQILLHLGQADEAWRVLATLEPSSDHEICPARFVAQLRLADGDLDGADRALHECTGLGDAHALRTLVDVYVLRSAIDHGRGLADSSGFWMDRALHILSASGAHHPFAAVPPAVLRAMIESARARPQSDAVLRLLSWIAPDTDTPKADIEQLSARELGVLREVQKGSAIATIAADLYISRNTVKTHLRNVYRKLGVASADEAVRKAESRGLYL